MPSQNAAAVDAQTVFEVIGQQQRLKVAHQFGGRLLVEADLVRDLSPAPVPFLLAYVEREDRPPSLDHAYAAASSAVVVSANEYLFLSNRHLSPNVPVEGRSLWRHRDGEAPTPLLSTPRDVVAFAVGGTTAVASAWLHRDAATLEEGRILRDARVRSGQTGVIVDGDLWPRSAYRFGDEVLKLVSVSLVEGSAEPQFMHVQLDDDTVLSGQVALTPDGRHCAAGLVRFLPDGHRHYGVLVFPLATSDEARAVWPGADVSDFIASPDGTWFACTAERIAVPGTAPRQEAMLISSDGLSVRNLAPQHPDWLQPRAWQDGQNLLCTGEQDGRRHLWRLDITTHVLRAVDCGGSVRSVTTWEGEGLVVRSTIDSPPSLARISLVRVKAPARELFAPASPAEPAGRIERLRYRRADGSTWSSWLCLPEQGDGPFPVLVWCHGGPMLSWADWSWRWNPWPFVANGYAVLMPDPPLSTGYGQDAIERGWGRWTSEVARVAAAQVNDALLDKRLDADRIAVMGASFGGYLSLALGTLLARPRLLVSHCGWADFAAVARACDLHWHWLREYGPVDESPLYPRESLSLEQIPAGTTVLLSHGCDDTHVPVGESRAVFRTLRTLGLDAELALFPDEKHSILRPANVALWYRWVTRALERTMAPKRKEVQVATQ